MDAIANIFGFGKKDEEQKQPEPVRPNPIDAKNKAKDDLRKKRKIQQNTGGDTILSSEYAGSATQKKTLLGQ